MLFLSGTWLTSAKVVPKRRGISLSTSELNGRAPSAPVSVNDAISEHVRGLEQLLIPLRAERDQLKARISDLAAQEKQIAHAIGALRSGPAPAAKPAPAGRKTGDWTPSEERLKSLFELFRAETEPISPTQLADKTEGLGVETAAKGARILRDRELLRVAAAIRGGGSAYAVMPGAEWPE